MPGPGSLNAHYPDALTKARMTDYKKQPMTGASGNPFVSARPSPDDMPISERFKSNTGSNDGQLRTRILNLLKVENAAIRKQAQQWANRSSTAHVVPPSQEWNDQGKRLLFIRYYFETRNKSIAVQRLAELIFETEIKFIQDRGLNKSSVSEMAMPPAGSKREERCGSSHNTRQVKKPVYKVSKVDIDQETKELLHIDELEVCTRDFLETLDKNSFQKLLLAWLEVYSALALIYSLDFDQASTNRNNFRHSRFNRALTFLFGAPSSAEGHGWEYWQAIDFPKELDHRIEVMKDLITQAQTYSIKGDFIMALHKMDTVFLANKGISEKLYGYIKERDEKAARFLKAIHYLQIISTIIVDVIILKNVKGMVNVLITLFAKNLGGQQIDKMLDLRQSVSVSRAVIDTLVARVSFAINQALVLKLTKAQLTTVTHELILAIADNMFSSIVSEIEEIIRKGGGFEDFLRGVYKKFIEPENWISSLASTAITKAYKGGDLNMDFVNNAKQKLGSIALSANLALSPPPVATEVTKAVITNPAKKADTPYIKSKAVDQPQVMSRTESIPDKVSRPALDEQTPAIVGNKRKSSRQRKGGSPGKKKNTRKIKKGPYKARDLYYTLRGTQEDFRILSKNRNGNYEILRYDRSRLYAGEGISLDRLSDHIGGQKNHDKNDIEKRDLIHEAYYLKITAYGDISKETQLANEKLAKDDPDLQPAYNKKDEYSEAGGRDMEANIQIKSQRPLIFELVIMPKKSQL